MAVERVPSRNEAVSEGAEEKVIKWGDGRPRGKLTERETEKRARGWTQLLVKWYEKRRGRCWLRPDY